MVQFQTNLATLALLLVVSRFRLPEVILTLIDSSNKLQLYFQTIGRAEKKSKRLKKIAVNCLEFVYSIINFVSGEKSFRFNSKYRCFTQFRNACEKKNSRSENWQANRNARSNIIDIQTRNSYFGRFGYNLSNEQENPFPFRGGENQALARLQEYLWNTKKKKSVQTNS